MPADPTPAPEWAAKMLVGAYNAPMGTWRLFTHDPIARLLAEVREAALREAAMVSVPFDGDVHSVVNPCDSCQFAYTSGALDAASAFHRAINALVGTAPKEMP